MFTYTLDFINKFNSIIDSKTLSIDEMDYVRFYEIEMATSLLRDLNSESVKRIGKILMAMADY